MHKVKYICSILDRRTTNQANLFYPKQNVQAYVARIDGFFFTLSSQFKMSVCLSVCLSGMDSNENERTNERVKCSLSLGI